MADFHSRRRLLALAGTGVATSIAGCSALQDDGVTTTATGDDPESTDTADADGTRTTERQDGDGGSAGDRQLALAVQPDQAALQQRRAEIQSQFQNGSLNRTAAQRQLQSAETELVAEAVGAFEDRPADETGVAVEESLPQAGLLLVSGSPADLVAALEFDEVNALLSADTYEQASQQTGG